MIENTPFAERLSLYFSEKKCKPCGCAGYGLISVHVLVMAGLELIPDGVKPQCCITDSVFVKTSQFNTIFQEKPSKALSQQLQKPLQKLLLINLEELAIKDCQPKH